jgi:RimJ/RimL family protein N-acetyltransferase
MYEYSSNPLFYEHMEIKPHKSIEETRAYLEKWLTLSKTGSRFMWFMFLKGDKKVIGSVGLWNIDWERKSAGIGYGISPDYWSGGYAKVVIPMVLQYLFFNLSFHRVHGLAPVNHLKSRIGAKQLGFTEEGTLRDYYLYSDGRREDAIVNSILKPDFNDRKNIKT